MLEIGFGARREEYMVPAAPPRPAVLPAGRRAGYRLTRMPTSLNTGFIIASAGDGGPRPRLSAFASFFWQRCWRSLHLSRRQRRTIFMILAMKSFFFRFFFQTTRQHFYARFICTSAIKAAVVKSSESSYIATAIGLISMA